MDTIRWFKTRAKALLKSLDHDTAARQRVATVLRDGEKISLQKAQHVVAVEAGFANWKALLDASDVERRLAVVMTEEPLLNDFGIGLYSGHRRKPREERMRILAEDRQRLRDSLDDVEWTAEWLRSNVEPIKTINRRRSSYGLKHIAEKHSPRGYLTNGVFIAAAMVAEYPFRITDSPNPQFGMSEKSIKRLSR